MWDDQVGSRTGSRDLHTKALRAEEEPVKGAGEGGWEAAGMWEGNGAGGAVGSG